MFTWKLALTASTYEERAKVVLAEFMKDHHELDKLKHYHVRSYYDRLLKI